MECNKVWLRGSTVFSDSIFEKIPLELFPIHSRLSSWSLDLVAFLYPWRMAFNQASIGRGSSRACPSGWQDDPGNCRDRPCVSKEARHACAIGLHPGQKTYYANHLIMMLILNNRYITYVHICTHSGFCMSTYQYIYTYVWHGFTPVATGRCSSCITRSQLQQISAIRSGIKRYFPSFFLRLFSVRCTVFQASHEQFGGAWRMSQTQGFSNKLMQNVKSDQINIDSPNRTKNEWN